MVNEGFALNDEYALYDELREQDLYLCSKLLRVTSIRTKTRAKFFGKLKVGDVIIIKHKIIYSRYQPEVDVFLLNSTEHTTLLLISLKSRLSCFALTEME